MTHIRFYNPYLNAYRDDSAGNSTPAANIYEADKEFQIEIALPGVDKKDIRISYEKGHLKVSVERDSENNNDNRYDRHEFDYRGAERVFKTGDRVNTDEISAKYENGVLSLILPKKEAFVQKPVRSIEVA
jgi:HSP20 family protein